MDVKELIQKGRTTLGIELGSTRIKSVLIDEDGKTLAAGNHMWENRFENGIWTYGLEEVWNGLQQSYADLIRQIKDRYGVEFTTTGAIGISAMMHGYMPFDKDGVLLTPFRTWRNTITGEASEALTELFAFHIPERWSVAHLYQAVLNGEEHVKNIDFLTTLAGYVHWKLTGEKVLGIGDASGMFPVAGRELCYDREMCRKFDEKIAGHGFLYKTEDIFPRILNAGQSAGMLTKEGAALLDLSGKLQAGIPFCPPEGDAGTGMTSTNSIAVKTGNISAGTSVFAMIVLEDRMKNINKAIDVVATPTGKDVAMVHCNNCTSEVNAWAGVFRDFLEAMGIKKDMGEIFATMYGSALKGDADCGGLLGYNYLSGESITNFSEGRPLFLRKEDSVFTLANFMKMQLYSSVATLHCGLEVLRKEGVMIEKMYGHGGFFKTKEVGQRIMAAAMNVPITVMDNAEEGGAWGMALLARYLIAKENGETLEAFLEDKIFAGRNEYTVCADAGETESYTRFIERYKKGLSIEAAAIQYS